MTASWWAAQSRTGRCGYPGPPARRKRPESRRKREIDVLRHDVPVRDRNLPDAPGTRNVATAKARVTT